ncbi:TVP38/TMEM64 family protein [Anaeromicrobium sediminis]|nr:VTT domain-containing protein [Anaeromicrobium sediminis]
MKKHNTVPKILMIIIWAFILLLIRYYFKISSLSDLMKFIEYNKGLSTVTFFIISSIRIFALLPGMPFMIMSGILFDPIVGFTLCMLSIIISETLIFILGKNSYNMKFINKINNKFPQLMHVSKKYNYKFLVLGILCPISPTDIICFISSYMGLSYRNFLLTIIIAHMPLILIYNILGQSFLYSTYYFIFLAVTLFVISIYLISIWNKVMRPTPQ